MAQYIKNANIWGRVGSGLGQGLAEQLPKEIERSRLASGLQQLESQKDLTPFQQFSRLASIPGITPQMLQSGSEILRQQGMSQGLQKIAQGEPAAFPQQQPREPSPLDRYNQPQQPQQGQQGVTTAAPVRATIENVLPKSREEILQRAAQLQQENPQLYRTANDAISAAQQENASEISRNQALQQQRVAQQGVQGAIEKSISDQNKRLGSHVPGDVEEKIRREAIDAVKNGATEEEASRAAGEKLDEISRQYSDLSALGGWSITGRKANSTLSSLKALQEKFEKRGDTRNFAQTLQSTANISAPLAYSIAEPVNRNPELSKFISKERPRIEKQSKYNIFYDPEEDSRLLAKAIIPKIKQGDSPMAIAYEFSKMGLDPAILIEEINNSPERENLTKLQSDQLTKPLNTVGSLNDWWLSSWTGVE